jgi:phage tail P2-like protein
MIDIRTANLIDIVPASIKSDPEIVAISAAINPEVRAVAVAADEANILARIDAQPESVLDAIAWGMRLNELQVWDVATVARKRTILKGILKLRKKSGTPYTVRQMLSLLENRSELVEWWEEDAAANTYRVRLFADDLGVTIETLEQCGEVLHRFERASQGRSELAVEADSEGTLHMYPALTIGRHTTIAFGGP